MTKKFCDFVNSELYFVYLPTYARYKNKNFSDQNYNKIKRINPKKNLVIGFGITDKTISSLKSANGLVVGSMLCKTITNSLKLGQNPVTKLDKVVYNLKRKIIWIGYQSLLNQK